MKKYLIGVTALAGTAWLAACTTALKVSPDQTSAEAVSGVPYALPMAQFEVTLTRQLTRCETDGEPDVAIVLGATAKPLYIAGETYVVDYESLSKGNKTASLVMDFHEETGTLKSINASSTDKTAEAIEKTLSTALNVAALVSGLPPLPVEAVATTESVTVIPPTQPKLPVLACTADAKSNVRVVEAAATVLTSATEASEAAVRTLKAMDTELTPVAELNALTLQQRRQWQAARDVNRRELAVLARAQAAVVEAMKPLTQTKTYTWPKAPDELSRDDELSEAEIAFWMAHLASETLPKLTRPAFCRLHPETDGSDTQVAGRIQSCLREKLKTSATLVASTPAPKFSKGGAVDGLLIRTPAQGRLRICNGQSADDCQSDGHALLAQSPTPISIPQLGQLRLLPFTNGFGQDNVLKLELRQDGRLAKFEYSDKAAKGSLATTVIDGATTQIQAFRAGQAAQTAAETAAVLAEVKAVRDSKLAELDYEIAVLTREKTKAAANADPSELEALQSQTALITARIALLQAQRAELEAQAGLNE